MGEPREFAFFADGYKADAKAVCDGGGKDETACIDADDFLDGLVTGGGAEEGNGLVEEGGVREDGGDVFEEDARLRKIWHIANGRTEGGGIHGVLGRGVRWCRGFQVEGR